MMKIKKQALVGLLALGIAGAGVLVLENPAPEAHGAETWAPSGIKNAQYQLTGAMTLPWTTIPVATATSTAGLDVNINKTGVTFLAVSTEDNAGNTAIDMEIIVVGELQTTPSPIRMIQYRLSGASQQDWSTYSTPFKITKEGVTNIEVRIEDEAGNAGTITREVKLDKSAPINNGVTITLN